MEIQSNKMGRVRPVPEGEHNAEREYRMLSIVYSEDTNKSYISKKDVPAGINIDNKIYWQVFGNGKFVDNAIINVSYLEDSIVPHTLAEAISMVDEEDRRPGIVLAFFEKESNYDEGNAWILYQFKGSSIDDWDKQQYWVSVYNRENKFKGWFLNSTELVERWPNPFKGDYAYVGQSLNNSWIWRCNDDGTWSRTSERFSSNAIINYYGDINNNPDFEDIDVDEQNRLKFANREPNENEMGYVILRKDKTFAEQVNKENTIYEIRYTFDLDNETITIPSGCTLKFIGGAISNGALIGNETQIVNTNVDIFDNIEISGSWYIEFISDKWFKTANKKSLLSVFALNNANIQTVIEIDKTYNIEFDTQNTQIALLSILSNTKLVLNGTINVDALDNHIYHIIDVYNSSNVYICGNGSIIGDRDIKSPEIIGEQGHGIQIGGSKNVIVEGITIKKCFGDGIIIGGFHGYNTPDNCSYNIIIRNCEILQCRRQGISIITCNTALIENNYIHHIYGTNPQSCIDVEGDPVDNITILANRLENSQGYILQTVGVNKINIIGNYLKRDDNTITTDRGCILIYNAKDIDFSNNVYEVAVGITYEGSIVLQGYNDNVKICKNNIKLLGTRHDATSALIRDITKTSNLIISDNIFYDVDTNTTLWKGFIIDNSEKVVFSGNNIENVIATYPNPTIVSSSSDLINVFVENTQALLSGKPVWWTGNSWVDATGQTV